MPEIVLTENGNAKVKDGKVLLKGDDGNEYAFDVINASTTTAELRTEAKTRRLKVRELEEQLSAFEGIENPADAIKALQTVSTMDKDHQKALDNLRAELEKSYEGKITETTGQVDTLKGEIFKLKVMDKFHSSEIAKKLIYQPEDAALIFGQNFTLDDSGNMVGKLNGETIYSKENPGKPAGFDEALNAMVEARPNHKEIIKGSGISGGGSPPFNQGGTNNAEPTNHEMIKSGLANLT